MKRTGILLLMLLTTTGPGLPAPPSPRDAVSEFLSQECGSPAEGPTESRLALQAAGGAAVGPLLEALEAGPPAGALAAVEGEARREHEALSRAVEAPPGADVYVRTRRQGYATAYRERALAGLALVGDGRAAAAIAALEPLLPPDLQRAAAETLARLSSQR